ncbi:MAG: PKD domain-containing protein, partial [Bacteroidales bacterium]|nr:PKD domain-containing protein [Bacteroidales bacterium]
MKKLLLNSLILISLILFGFTSFAYNYTVYGYITDGDENPMSQVEVNIFEMNSYQDPTSTNYVTVYSDTDGYYEGLVSVQNTSDTLSTLLITVYAYCNGITETQTIEIVVQEEGQQQVDFEICSSNSGNDCFLGFYYYPSNFNFLEINFMSYSFMENSNDSVSIVNYEWDFGDGTTSTETNPVHIYNEEGTYNVVLTASSEECGELTYADLVYVSSDNVENCYADFYYYFDFEDSTSSDIPTNYNIINFVDASWAITDITSWTWEFGDGITSTEQNPTHEYTEDGEYLVSLTIETNDCSSTTEYYVWIGDPVDECYLGFYYYPSNFNYSEINFISYSFMDNYNDSIYIVNYEWDFGDGTTSTETNPVHIYNEEGTYIVVLTASSEECG